MRMGTKIWLLMTCFIGISSVAQAQTSQTIWRLQNVNTPTPSGPSATNCSQMDSELSAAVAAHRISCQGHAYLKNPQQCIAVSNRMLSAAQGLRNRGTACTAWPAASLQNNINVAQIAIRNSQSALAQRSRASVQRSYRPAPRKAVYRSRGGSGGGGGYSGGSGYSYQRPIGLQPSYVPCIGGSTDANGMRVCY